MAGYSSSSADRHAAWLLTIGLPASAGFLLHYGFVGHYTTRVFNAEGFEDWFGSGIYRFRIVGRSLVLFLAPIVERVGLVAPIDLRHLDAAFDPALYATLALVNSVALICTSIVLFRFLDVRLPRAEAIGAYLLTLVVILLSLYVVTPYDALSYACIAGAVGAFHWRGRVGLVWLASLMVVGTATRETQVLCLAYAAAWAGMYGRPIPWTRLLVMGVSFLAVYVSLRIGLGFSQAVASHRTFPWWLADPLALATIASAGLLLWSLAAIQLTDGTAPRARRGLIWLYVWSLPYLVMIAVVGLPRELRLIVPIALLQTMLAAQLRSESPGVANSGEAHHALAPRQ